jgi:protein-tyrosine-phosphatase
MKVLFICKNNQFRSQMAAAIYNKLTSTDDAFSAGTFVGHLDNPEGVFIEQFFRTKDFFEIMEQNGMYIRSSKTKKLLPEILDQADIVVSMAEEPFVPDFLREAKKVIFWDVENPPFATKEVSKKTYIKILKLVKKLIKSF